MGSMSEQEFQDYSRDAYWALRTQMDENKKTFQLDAYPRFDWSQWRGELIFSSGGTPAVLAKIQVVGTHLTKSTAWIWAWTNTGYSASLLQGVQKTRQFGAERGITRLIQPRWPARESDAWEMTAVTAKLNEAKGGFRCPCPDGFTYLVFTEIRAVSDRKRVFGAQTCSHVLDEKKPILLVSRELDGEVVALCGGENDSAATTRNLSLDRLLELDHTLSLLGDLPDGWVALRESADDDWVPSKAE